MAVARQMNMLKNINIKKLMFYDNMVRNFDVGLFGV